ncbi:DUF721 domain-containing protein [Runella rosea]|jgi:predicted nucleic acid-binding Zn ribbon protein|uniref:DUF721 domain-containing protein n=3 Tax=Runella TaxID=105 RepID=A0A344TRG3_9BACT|nr:MULTISPECIES: DUF721 domain-containing protein [Runella]AXE21234.1 DUF721 domain-containing protein [Runella rosea]MCP1384539.1 DUF721 domain-containing protein [Runella salmonicolor]NBB19393.1 DUF721 domain-containing protein [Runella sp. CRIBMP]RDB07721.1 DUF721 domain-containing protein [Runella aurantiaca]
MVYRFKKENAARRPGVTTVGDAINKMLEIYRLRGKFDESSVKVYWEKLVGKEIASRTSDIYVKDKVLFLRLDSAPLANELVIAKRKLIQSLNDSFGYELITDIVFI